MLILILALTYGVLPNQNNDNELISSYGTDYRSIIIFKHLPSNYSKIHYKPNFSKEQFPLKNHKPFGAFYPYGGLIQFDDPIARDNIVVIKIPHECRHLYISTLANSFFRIGTSPSNVTFEKNLNICLLNAGNPSEINVNMSTESFSKLSILSIDDNTPRQVYSGNHSFVQRFNQSAILFFQTSYFYLNNFVNISIKQISNERSLEPHSLFVSKSSLNGSLCLLLEDPIIYSHQGETSNTAEELIKPTFHHLDNNHKYVTDIYDDNHKEYKPSYDLGNNNDDFSDESNILVKLIVISVFMVCGAILIGCCGLLCVCCYTCSSKDKKNATNKPQNNLNNGFLLNEDKNFDDAIPPTIPKFQTQYQPQPQQYYPTQPNFQQSYFVFYPPNNQAGQVQQNFQNQPIFLQQSQHRQYTD